VRDTEAIAEQDFPVFSRGLAIGSCTKERLGNLNIPMLFGGVHVRPGDIVIGNADGVVILEQERADEIYEASVKRRQRETQLIADLRSGRTTLDLLGLPGLRDETETAPN